jgi:hypothetical protein
VITGLLLVGQILTDDLLGIIDAARGPIIIITCHWEKSRQGLGEDLWRDDRCSVREDVAPQLIGEDAWRRISKAHLRLKKNDGDEKCFRQAEELCQCLHMIVVSYHGIDEGLPPLLPVNGPV